MFWKVAAILIIALLGLNLVNDNKTLPQTQNKTSSISITPTSDVLSENTQTEEYKVTKVIDGDTVQISKNTQTLTLRLIGIDTPETSGKTGVQCFGQEAEKKAKDMLSDRTVSLETDETQGEKDRYGRRLAYIFINGINFNKLMIEEGFAHEYTYQTPYKYQKEFKKAEANARENKKGLWADGACNTTIIQTSTSPNIPTAQETQVPKTSSGNYSCDCSKKCTQMATCDEAYYQLNSCGCSSRDSDGDGVPCESLCK